MGKCTKQELAYAKKYREEHKEEYAIYNKNYLKKYALENKKKLIEYNKTYRLINAVQLKKNAGNYRNRNRLTIRIRKIQNKFKISFEEAQKLYNKTYKICDICKQKETARGFNLSIDHCHKTGKIRGVLCSRCNLTLGGFKDNIILLKRAIKYLKGK